MEVSVMNKPIAILVLLGFFALSACTGNKNSSPDRFTPQEEAEQQLQIEGTAEQFIQWYELPADKAQQVATKYTLAQSLSEKNRIFKEATGLVDDKEAQKFNQAINNIEISEDRRNTISQSIEIERILRDNNTRAKALIQDNCVLDKDRFAQGQADNLYGKACLDGKYLEIKTAKTGILEPAFSSFSANKENGEQDIQEEVDFLSTSYKVKYSISTDSGDAKDYALLLKFLKEDEEFIGGLEKSYRIIFRIFKDYLVLYKASKEKDDFPQNERMTGYANSGLQKEGDYYMIPFIGYPISFCVAEPIRNSNNQITNQNRINCDNISQNNSKDVPYIQLDTTRKEVFDPIIKTDWLPIDYFEGKWYYIASSIKSKIKGELHSDFAKLVEFKPEQDFLDIKDVSVVDVIENAGTIYQQSFTQLPVKWRNFELDLDGKKFKSFAEREYNPDKDHLNKPYVEINFENLKNITDITFSGLSNLIINDDFFSFIQTGINNETNTEVQIKIAFLKQSALDTEGFKPRRWFFDDHEKLFGIMPAIPFAVREIAQYTKDEKTKHIRMSKFNTSLNTDEEKNSKTKIIKWYFSKNSTTDPEYRSSAKKAIDIYNKAFENIMWDSCPEEIKNEKNGEDCPKVQLELVSDKLQDLGDIRYNIINLIETLPDSTGVVGKAPTFVDSTTGQVVGATSNILIHTHKESLAHWIRNYIRYEIFQKDIRTHEENEIHVVTPYLRKKIERSCPEVTELIKQFNTSTPQNQNLKDREVILSCAEKLSKQTILSLILHELGHNFGIAHNFKCSMDPYNFYIDHAEMIAYFGEDLVDSSQPVSKSSCVMDYIHFSKPQLNVLGKYDLATLRFLYTNQVEVLKKAPDMQDPEEAILPIQWDENPLNQISLSQSNENISAKYLTCADWQKGSLTCVGYDYGKDPGEVVKNEFLNIKRIFNSRRYRYDADPKEFFELNYTWNLSSALDYLNLYYNKWLDLKNALMNTKGNPSDGLYQSDNKEASKSYTDTLSQHYLDSTTEKDYKMYYPVKSVFKQEIMDWLLIEEMTCQVEYDDLKGETKKAWVTLEFLKSQILNEDLYVENCFSPAIKDFLDIHYQNVTIISQKGYENFKTASYYSSLEHPNYVIDILPLSFIYDGSYSYKEDKTEEAEKRKIKLENIIEQLSQEPDIIYELAKKIKDEMLDGETFQSQFKANQTVRIQGTIQQALRKILSINDNISEKYINDLARYTVPLHNFYNDIQQPAEKQAISIPFVKEVWDNYNSIYQTKTEKSFQVFFLEQDEVVKKNERIAFPHQSDSFIAEVIKNLNKNIKELKEIRQKNNLSLMESYTKQTLETEQKKLTEYIGI